MSINRIIALLGTCLLVSVISGCSIVNYSAETFWGAIGQTEIGTVISRTVFIRSSYAVVAADVLEVKRGEKVEILGETEMSNVVWYNVRAGDADRTRGWIEAQHIIKSSILEDSKRLAEEVADRPSVAIGRLRARSNLRLTPESIDSNILQKLSNRTTEEGSRPTFEIVDWKYVDKVETDEDDGASQDVPKVKDSKRLSERYDIWYRIRIDPSLSPAPMGWLFGRQVNLEIPGDIIYYQTNRRKFVMWQSLEDFTEEAKLDYTNPTSRNPLVQTGSWVIFTRTNEVKEVDGVEPYFDGLLILGFDKYNEEHYMAYNSARERVDIWGDLPVKIEGTGGEKSLVVRLRNRVTNEIEEKSFRIYKDQNRRLRVTPPPDLRKVIAKS